ncbi:hypothetical protein POTOM_049743 [Populus tomentosa]|uniref:Disease resistance protein winged helix domain-containing protein n=1 Tax=Populus tomentosa TaxID=118781 RepID=A0A8X7YD14_POPTO|nr:hypothetical protein POTOM_049743 [Populus tomentosa]
MIRRKWFIKLWIAEGFVKMVRGATLEEISENYLMEFICRSMLQVLGEWKPHRMMTLEPRTIQAIYPDKSNEEGPLRIDALSSPPCLEKLKLVGKMEKIKRSSTSLPTSSAQFGKAYVGKQLCFLNGFQKLKILNTYNCNHLNEIVLEKEMMPGLQSLSLGRCMKLKALPHGIDIHNC